MIQTENIRQEENMISYSICDDKINDSEKSIFLNNYISKRNALFQENLTNSKCNLNQNQLETLYKNMLDLSNKKQHKREPIIEITTSANYEQLTKTEKDHKTVNINTPKIEKFSNTNISSSARNNAKDGQFYIEIAESVENCPGNYQNYVTKSLKSINKLRKLCYEEEYINSLNSRRVNLGIQDIEKKTLILDLDETLIHTDFNNLFINHDKVLNFKLENFENQIPVPIMIRPGLKQFLQVISEKYEIVVFTASKKEYANTVLNFLDPENKLIKHRFFREHCISLFGKIFIKDLRIFNDRKMEDMIIVDNSMYSFANQLSNGILITSFFNDRSDMELNNLGNYLVNCLAKVKDIRTENEKFFKFESMQKYWYNM